MATVNEALLIAADLFNAGKTAEAEVLLGRILDAAPGQPEAANLLGVLSAQSGRVAESVAHFAVAAASRRSADYHVNYATALAQLGRSAEAAAAYGDALAMAPGRRDAARALALIHLHDGRRRFLDGDAAGAENDLRRAATLNPDDAEAPLWLGAVLRELRSPTAVAALRRAASLDPAAAAVWANLAAEGVVAGVVAGVAAPVVSADESTGCVSALYRRTALCRLPEVAIGDFRGRAVALMREKRAAAAVVAGCAAVAVDPADVAAWSNLGAACRDAPEAGAGRIDGGAERCFRRALRIDRRNVAALVGLSETLRDAGAPDDALREARKAVSFAPHVREARLALALAALTVGRLAEGWKHYDARWRDDGDAANRRLPLSAPTWDGGALDGPLLAWGEQGVGDEIMLASLLPDLTARGVDLRLWIDRRLHPLFARSFPGATLLRRGSADDALNCGAAAEIAMGDLPRFFRNDPADFPVGAPPSLRADPQRAAAVRARLARRDGEFVVGLSWRSVNARYGAVRSIDAAALVGAVARAAAVAGRPLRAVNLQYDATAAEIAAVAAQTGVALWTDPEIDLRDDLDGAAAVIDGLDLVVCIDNSVAHLAGALGARTWLAAPFAADWRWMTGREDSPWHPTMRLFRQPRPGDWGAALAAIETLLARGMAGDAAVFAPPSVVAPAVDEADQMAQEREKYRHMWRQDDYRTLSPGELQSEQFNFPELLRRRGARTVLDAGCGTGKTSIHLIENGGDAYRVYGFDIADNCLEPYFDGFKDDYLTVGCLWRRGDFHGVYDAVICTDVMEHIPTEHVPAVLSNLRAVCRNIAFFGIALYDDGFGPAELGEPLHLTVKPTEWWLDLFNELGFKVLSSKTLHHPSVGPAWLYVEAEP